MSKDKKVNIDKIKDSFEDIPYGGMKDVLSGIKKDVIDRVPEVLKSARYPRVDMTEKEDKIVVVVEIPGLKADEISVAADKNSLTVTGTPKKDKQKNMGIKIIEERRKEAFKRTLGLPAVVDVDKARATRRLGILTVKIPKVEKTKKTRLEIE